MNIIRQTVTLPATPKALFVTYLDSKQHAAVIGDKVSISRKEGGRFTAFNGMLKGRTLLILPKHMIVQAWRAKSWKKADPDSILILQFAKVPGGAQITLIHVNVPDHDYVGVKKGWPKYYWTPWKLYLKGKRGKP